MKYSPQDQPPPNSLPPRRRILGKHLIIPGIVGAIAAVIGFGASVFTKRDDTPTEELAEQVLEEGIEQAFNLPDNSLKGTIDLSPGSSE